MASNHIENYAQPGQLASLNAAIAALPPLPENARPSHNWQKLHRDASRGNQHMLHHSAYCAGLFSYFARLPANKEKKQDELCVMRDEFIRQHVPTYPLGNYKRRE